MATLGDIAIGLKMDSSKFSAGAQTARKDIGIFGTVCGSVVGQVAALASASALAFGAFKAISWGSSMAAEAEKSSIAFEVMLGSADKAQTMLKGIEDYAAKTPYELAGTREAAQLLLNYGVAGERVLPTLSMLGDIASGDANKLHSLAVAFGQSSATGRLMGQDLNQMINAGFNPLQEISKRTGESMAELKKRMEAGGIATSEVTQAFKDATSEGGRFYLMTEKQSQTTSGLWSTLKDNVALAMRDIASALMEGFGVKDVFRDLISDSDSFRKNIGEWIPTFKSIGEGARVVFEWMYGALKLLTDALTKSAAGWSLVLSLFNGSSNSLAPTSDESAWEEQRKKIVAFQREFKANQVSGAMFVPNVGRSMTGGTVGEFRTASKEMMDEQKKWLDGLTTQLKEATAGIENANPMKAGKDGQPFNGGPLFEDFGINSVMKGAYKPGGQDQIDKANKEKKDWEDNLRKQDRVAAAKGAGAIAVGSREFFASIFQGLGKGDPAQQTRQQQLAAQRETLAEQKRIRQDLKTGKIATVSRLGGV